MKSRKITRVPSGFRVRSVMVAYILQIPEPVFKTISLSSVLLSFLVVSLSRACQRGSGFGSHAGADHPDGAPEQNKGRADTVHLY